MSERNKKIGLGKKGLPDMVLSILKALGSCSPATAPLASLLSDFQNQKQYQLIEDTLSKFSAMIGKLDERVRNIEYMNSQECVCDLLRTVDHVKDEIDEEKRIMYAKYLTACCHIENADSRFKRIFLEYMGKMDGLDLYILKSLNTTFNCKNIIEDVENSYNYSYNCNVTKKEVLNHVYYLTSLGLIEMSDEEEVVKFLKRYDEKPFGKTFKKSYMYQRTTLGDDLYQFIKKAEV